jgi:hypothetical protein
MLFGVAWVPYLSHIQGDADKVWLFTYLDRKYVLGSLLFLIGGAVNYCRAFKAGRNYRAIA